MKSKVKLEGVLDLEGPFEIYTTASVLYQSSRETANQSQPEKHASGFKGHKTVNETVMMWTGISKPNSPSLLSLLGMINDKNIRINITIHFTVLVTHTHIPSHPRRTDSRLQGGGERERREREQTGEMTKNTPREAV